MVLGQVPIRQIRGYQQELGKSRNDLHNEKGQNEKAISKKKKVTSVFPQGILKVTIDGTKEGRLNLLERQQKFSGRGVSVKATRTRT